MRIDLRGAVRFEVELSPTAAQWSAYQAGTLAWEELDWVAQVYENLGATDRFSMRSQLSTRKMRQVLMEWLAT